MLSVLVKKDTMDKSHAQMKKIAMVSTTFHTKLLDQITSALSRKHETYLFVKLVVWS